MHATLDVIALWLLDDNDDDDDDEGAYAGQNSSEAGQKEDTPDNRVGGRFKQDNNNKETEQIFAHFPSSLASLASLTQSVSQSTYSTTNRLSYALSPHP